MKAILISDHAKWCALMMNGDKTVEVRKGTALYKAIQKLIDEYGFAEFYVYCTKDKKYANLVNRGGFITGMVAFKFRCYKVEEIFLNRNHFVNEQYSTDELDYEELLDKSCLTYRELDNYLQCEIGCAIHISDLEIFDRPKELFEFDRCILTEDLSHDNIIHIHQRFKTTKAPQSFCYIEVGE